MAEIRSSQNWTFRIFCEPYGAKKTGRNSAWSKWEEMCNVELLGGGRGWGGWGGTSPNVAPTFIPTWNFYNTRPQRKQDEEKACCLVHHMLIV